MSERDGQRRYRVEFPPSLAARVDLDTLRPAAEADIALENMVIRHREFDRLSNRLASHHMHYDPSPLREAGVLIVSGMSGAGKSSTLKRYAAEFPVTEDEKGVRRQVLYVQVPSGADKHSLQRRILHGLEVPVPHRRTQDALTLLIDYHIRAQRMELLILDESNHLADLRTNEKRFLAGDMIKELANFNSCQIVVAGMDSSMALLERNLQLARRSRMRHVVKPYDWTVERDRNDYEDFLDEFADAMRFRSPPPLSAWSEALSVASWGLPGITSLLLVRANGVAFEAQAGALELEHLVDAFDELKPKGTRGNPFVSLRSVKFPKNYVDLLVNGVERKTGLRSRMAAAQEEAAE
jgi:hypothetical protein